MYVLMQKSKIISNNAAAKLYGAACLVYVTRYYVDIRKHHITFVLQKTFMT